MQGPRTRPRKPVRRGEVLFAVGGWCSGDAIASVERYDPQTNEWRMVSPMSKRRCGVGVAVLNDLLYAVGGHDGQSYLNSIERFDPQTNQWSSDVAPTSSCRTSVGVAVLDGSAFTYSLLKDSYCIGWNWKILLETIIEGFTHYLLDITPLTLVLEVYVNQSIDFHHSGICMPWEVKTAFHVSTLLNVTTPRRIVGPR